MSNPSDGSVKVEAVERADRAKKYAGLFPKQVGVNDLRFQDVNWQEDYLRRIYKLPPIVREVVNINGKEEVVNTGVDVNSRKAYMRKYMAKKRALKRGEKVDAT